MYSPLKIFPTLIELIFYEYVTIETNRHEMSMAFDFIHSLTLDIVTVMLSNSYMFEV